MHGNNGEFRELSRPALDEGGYGTIHTDKSGIAPRGKANFIAPPMEGKSSNVMKHWNRLLPFFQNVDSILEDLGGILKGIARNNAVVVLTCNMGQSALLMNFACNARRRGFDLGNVLVFPSDVETKDLAEGLGLTTYYDEKVRRISAVYPCAISTIPRLTL